MQKKKDTMSVGREVGWCRTRNRGKSQHNEMFKKSKQEWGGHKREDGVKSTKQEGPKMRKN